MGEEESLVEKRQYLMLPGPTPVPPRLLRAMAKPAINHRGPEFKALYAEVTEGLKEVFRTKNDVIIYTASGTGAMEAAVANFISPGDKVLVVSIGVFGNRFAAIAERFGAQVEKLEFTWGTAADPDALAERIKADEKKEIKAVLVTHNETSTGVTNDLKALREAVGDHPALFIVDSVSGLGAMELETDAWNLDVVVAGSQKSFMIPPGLSFMAVGPRAWEAKKKCKNACFYWDIEAARKSGEKGQTPFTPAIPQIEALAEALEMMREEGLENIFARHRLLRDMTRQGIKAMGLKPLAADDVASPAVTAVLAPEGIEANAIRKVLLNEFNVVVAGGQQSLDNKIFRIGHLGNVGELEIIAVLAALEMALNRCGFKVELGVGVRAAQEVVMKGGADD
ncbi:MAG: pyridoxal-phosphate-dependent aminotransferase family protein [Thermacetogeniaceae bacterium]